VVKRAIEESKHIDVNLVLGFYTSKLTMPSKIYIIFPIGGGIKNETLFYKQ